MYQVLTASIARSVTSILLVLLGCNAMAAEVKWINVERDGRYVDVRSEIIIDASLPEVYAALLDYDQFAKLGGTFAESHYIEPAADGTPRIYTRTEGCIWFFCKTIERVARIEVEPQRKIIATAEPEKSDAELSIESWTLTAADDSTIIEYRHEINTGFWIPPLLGPLIINRSVKVGIRQAATSIENLATGNDMQNLAQN